MNKVSLDEEKSFEAVGKIALFLSIAILGVLCGFVVSTFTESIIVIIFGGFVFAIANPFISAISTNTSETLHEMAFPSTYKKWPVYIKVWHAAFWPFTLPYWIVISIFFSAINRLFR